MKHSNKMSKCAYKSVGQLNRKEKWQLKCLESRKRFEINCFFVFHMTFVCFSLSLSWFSLYACQIVRYRWSANCIKSLSLSSLLLHRLSIISIIAFGENGSNLMDFQFDGKTLIQNRHERDQQCRKREIFTFNLSDNSFVKWTMKFARKKTSPDYVITLRKCYRISTEHCLTIFNWQTSSNNSKKEEIQMPNNYTTHKIFLLCLRQHIRMRSARNCKLYHFIFSLFWWSCCMECR